MQALRLVNTLNMTNEDWLEHRRLGIGGSDAAAICGLSRYRSPMAVYLDKLGELPPLEDNPKMKAGRILEPVIADWFAEDTGYKVWRRNSIFQHPDHPFMLANIDRWLPGQNAGLECKNTAEYCKDDWSGTQAPTEYILQCNHYMAVTGADRWFIAVLIGGWDFQWRVIERDEALIKNLITIEKGFWEEHVMAKVPPSFSHQDTELLKNTYAESTPDSWVELPEEAYTTIQKLHQARVDKSDAEKREETAKNQIKGYMQDCEKAYFQGDLRFTWKTGKRGRTFRVVGGDE
ncbi:YqaJ viral recombinase family protein [Brevibacillus choshinensis]|uniref:YqaJ viral recombinase family nuclease n=1 Tax=Brevibacillus choshinensis TaxID=54911 RepID=UPI002E22F006|nr:YqaJ viral recombinase family protein [Brevibacillus choshinensis]